MKRVVVCCDGTWNTAHQKAPTNVWKTHQALAPTAPDGTRQVAHYLQGVGTGRRDRLLGGAFGLGLSAHVKAGYRFVVDQLDPGDELFLLGFSRGAYTARSLAGLVRKAGVLRRDLPGWQARVDDAYAHYRSDVHPRDPRSVAFRERWSWETRIRFVGVWDTVGALGIPISGFAPVTLINRRWQFHDTQLSSTIDAAFHAVAVDERRQAFLPTLWEPQPDAGDQRVEQVWFTGVHCDVGGGYPETGLSDLALRWLTERAGECGLAWRDGALQPPSTHPDPLAAPHDSRTGLFGLLPAVERTIGRTDPDHESAASTAIEHQDAAEADHQRYARNLRRYRRSPGFRVTDVETP